MNLDKEKGYVSKEEKIKRLLKGIDRNSKYLVEFGVNEEVIRVVELEDEYMAGSKVYVERWWKKKCLKWKSIILKVGV